MLRYRCLVLDHDDTAVNSTVTLHYPAFLRTLQELRSGQSISLPEFFRKNFSPGFHRMCVESFGFTAVEMETEYRQWLDFVKDKIPEFFDGMPALLARFRAEGGVLCVASHSVSFNIRRDYEANGLPVPELIFGCDAPEAERKPAPFPVQAAMRRYGLKNEEVLVVDDLPTGFHMAKNAEVPFACAAWSYALAERDRFMEENEAPLLRTVAELEHLLFV